MNQSTLPVKLIPLLLLSLAALSWAAAQTQTVIYDLAAKPEETRRRVYEQANAVNLAARRTPQPPLKGKVIQCVRGTSYLLTTDEGTTFLVDLLPGRGPLPQGAAVSCSVDYVGLYEYNSVEGVQKQVKRWKEMTEAERTGKKWKTYAEFCDWLKLGNTCVLRKNEPVRCTLCNGTGVVAKAAGSPASSCSRCGGRGRDTLTTLYNLVWKVQPHTRPPVAAPAASALAPGS